MQHPLRSTTTATIDPFWILIIHQCFIVWCLSTKSSSAKRFRPAGKLVVVSLFGFESMVRNHSPRSNDWYEWWFRSCKWIGRLDSLRTIQCRLCITKEIHKKMTKSTFRVHTYSRPYYYSIVIRLTSKGCFESIEGRGTSIMWVDTAAAGER